MNTRNLVALALLLMPACNMLRHVPGVGGAGAGDSSPSLPDIYTVSGVAKSNGDKVAIRTQDSIVTVTATYQDGTIRVLNKYEAFPRNGYVEFGYRVDIAGSILILYNAPAVPIGSHYRICSTITHVEHSLY